MNNYWNNKSVAILGGSALIGSHLVERLLKENPKNLWVVDDLSSGRLRNLPDGVKMIWADLREFEDAKKGINGADIVFHLACAHGGRGYVDTHEIGCYDNLSLDAKVFRTCAHNGVEKVVFASSACVYPIHLQQNIDENLYITEDLVDYNNVKQADGSYGLSKLMAEQTLNAYSKDGRFDHAICRFFTVYGERMKENHAIAALIAKSYIKQDPFEIWGDGKQKRNWTYVKDTVEGMVLAGEKLINDVVNIGTEDVNTPISACENIWKLFDWKPEAIKFLPDNPVGPVNRIANAQKAKRLLGWEPKYTFKDGIKNTIDWYLDVHKEEEIARKLKVKLHER